MRGIIQTAAIAAIALGSQAPSVLAADSVTEALSTGKINLGFRLRYEDVDIDGSDEMDLLSLRTRLTYSSGSFAGFSGLIEMDDVTHFSDFEGGISDPEGTEVNQALLAYSFADTTAKYGRQRILLDNQRFVGGVGFRQNEQTYDAISVLVKDVANTELFLANINNVNRIFGEDVATGDHENDTLLFNGKYTGLSFGSLSAYAYLIENDDLATFSTDTFGLRFAGKMGIVSYAAEYATQSDADNNPLSYDADYWLAEGGVKLGSVNVTLGYEVLGADEGNGQFITPLATLHAFQGWTDVFLGGGSGNIPGGIEDIYLKVGATFANIKFLLKYHDFSADDASFAAGGADDYGSEIGMEIAKDWKNYGLSLKYADYSADDFGTDTSKLWLTAVANF